MNNPKVIFFDSSVYVNVLKDREFENRIEKFLLGPLYVINKIVLRELWAGVRSKKEETILRQHQQVLPLIGLEDDNFVTAGQILGKMRKDWQNLRRRITWDLLIVLSAAENNAVILTKNVKNFSKLQRYLKFQFIPV